jgi:hypothetical protein
MGKLYLALTTVAALLLTVDAASAADNVSTPAFTVLTETADQLREDFNQAKGRVRVLFVVDPLCPGCLRGLDDLNKALLRSTSDPRLQTFVVHVPVLKPAPKATDIPPATQLLQNSHVRHYWNPSGSFGTQLAEGVDLKHDGQLVYAWDVWLIYGPDAVWSGENPPKPRLLMHQLRALRGSTTFPCLDSNAFAREVRMLLTQLPPSLSPQ